MIDKGITSKLLEAYFNDTCSEADKYRVERWMATREQGDESLDLFHVVSDKIDIRDNALAEKAYEKCVTVLNLPGKQDASKGGFRGWMAAVSAIAAILAVMVVLQYHQKRSDSTREIPFQEVYAERGTSETVVLPDGSTILLKAGSRLIYPQQFRGTTREVFLSGECYASIAKNPDMPFVLSTGSMNIRVTGTEFNVKSFPEDSESEVALVEGSVLVDSKPVGDHPVQSIAITPGKVVKVDRKSGETRINGFDTNNYTDAGKKEDVFIFLDQRFCDIASELSRRLDVDILLMDEQLGGRRFYASFINGEDLNDMLNSFNADKSMVISREGRTIKISRKKV